METQQNTSHTPSKGIFERFSSSVTKATGSSAAFLLALGTVILWAITGPIFGYSENWQLVINTGTTIITFLMVFLIQKAQNKESMSVQLKLNELIAATKGASNRLVSVEDLTEEELCVLQQHYQTMAEITQKASDLRRSHSIEEAIKDASEKLEEESGMGHTL
ncbi:low affinity iron permease family protein [Spirosoma radiotolerans]|uniref:Membrane protein n=1 Tax=Spirosoma radiotolerans TaxID=1379870 RepID=A0A0E3ZX36_9BACT|nr:low affinity iron permease family protein [Spirosoma radiotolerans]AKD56923.1 membrane protein [Spirosoma radiotolerans]